jgi:hypothetical protein
MQIIIIGSQQFQKTVFIKKLVDIGTAHIFIFGVEFQAEDYKGQLRHDSTS